MQLSQRLTLAAGALFALLGVMAGAAGAHLLPGTVSAQELARFDTAVSYQMYHALALLLVASLQSRGNSNWLIGAATCFSGGILLFSGSLYTRILLEAPLVAKLTPFGGTLLMLGWLAVVAAAIARD